MFQVHRVKIRSRCLRFFLPLGWGCRKRRTCASGGISVASVGSGRSVHDQHRGELLGGLCGEPPTPHLGTPRQAAENQNSRPGGQDWGQASLVQVPLVALGLFTAETPRSHKSFCPSWQTQVSSDILVTTDRKHTHSDSGRSRHPGSPAGRAGAMGALGFQRPFLQLWLHPPCRAPVQGPT